MKKILEHVLVLFTGILFAYWLNVGLPYYFISFEGKIFWLLVLPVLILILFFVSFQRFKTLNLYRKGRIALLGASVVSLVFASYNFCGLVCNGVMIIEPLTFINLYKAILLASLFSFLERLLKFFEDRY